ncbi:MAG: FecR domain-containing protein [Tannerella sp.]|nr:FecR domain-containing protein [Tannerella sp.]
MNEQLLVRFLMKQCSAEELKSIDRWVAADPAHADWLYEMEHLWSLKDELRFSDEQEIKRSYRRFLSGINRSPSPNTKEKRWKISTFVRYAAAILLAALLAVNGYDLLRSRTLPLAMNTIEVPVGQRVSLLLSDGTKVWLNAGSTLSYPSTFGKESRPVSLIGEAFFEVAHDADKPFVVQSDRMYVEVKGTKFCMKTYPEERAVVTLAEGSVQVSSVEADYRVMLKPNEQVSYSEQEGWVLTEHVDAELTRSWIHGELYFVEQPLSEIAKSLERRFGVRIRICNPLSADDTYTCHFRETDSLERVLSLLKETRQLDYKKRNDGVIEMITIKK